MAAPESPPSIHILGRISSRRGGSPLRIRARFAALLRESSTSAQTKPPVAPPAAPTTAPMIRCTAGRIASRAGHVEATASRKERLALGWPGVDNAGMVGLGRFLVVALVASMVWAVALGALGRMVVSRMRPGGDGATSPGWRRGIEWSCIAPAFAKVPEGRFSILVHHYPALVGQASALGADLHLAGDTHGGQIRLPLLGPLIRIHRMGIWYPAGLHRVESTWLYVNRGIGMEGGRVPRARFMCRPEIAVIDLAPL